MHRAWDSWLLSISSFPSASCKRQLWPISTFEIFDQKKRKIIFYMGWEVTNGRFFVASLSVLKHLNFARQEGKCSWIALIWKEFLWGAAPDGWLDGWTDRSPLLATTTAIPSTFRMHVVYWYIVYCIYMRPPCALCKQLKIADIGFPRIFQDTKVIHMLFEHKFCWKLYMKSSVVVCKNCMKQKLYVWSHEVYHVPCFARASLWRRNIGGAFLFLRSLTNAQSHKLSDSGLFARQ